MMEPNGGPQAKLRKLSKEEVVTVFPTRNRGYSRHLCRSLLAVVLLMPAAGALPSWENALADPGRTSRDGNAAGVDLPVSIRGYYQVGGEQGFFPALMVDHPHVYLLSSRGVAAMERIEESDDSVVFDESTVKWAYELEPPDNPMEIRQIGTVGLFSAASMATRVGGMIVFAESEQNFLDFTDVSTTLVGLNRLTGEEMWRHRIEGAAMATLNTHEGDLFVRYELPAQDEGFTGRLIRITPGAGAPTREAEIMDPGDNPDLVIGGQVFFLENDAVSSFATETLDRLWTYPGPGTSLEDVHGGTLVQNMVAEDGHLFLTLDENMVLSLDAQGGLRWERELLDSPCDGVLRLSKHRDVLLVSGLCGNEQGNSRIMGLDPATGGILWETTTNDQINTFPPIISGDVAYLSGRTDDWETPAVLLLYDVHTGDLLQEARGFRANSGSIIPMAAANGHLYGATIGTLGSGDGRIVVYETEPGSIAPRFDAENPYPCGVPRDSSIPVPINMVNEGPGLAPDVTLRVASHGVPVEWEVPAELDHRDFGQVIRIDMGDMEPLGHALADLRVVPLAEGEVILEATVTMDVRNIDPDGGTSTVSFEVGPPVPGNIDIAIDWVEVTQGLQDGDHSIGLIAGKPTLIRVYPRTNAPLDGTRASMEISGRTSGSNWSRSFDETIDPLQSCLPLAPGDPDRGDVNASFNFMIPPRMLDGIPQGPFEVRIVLDPDNILQEQDRSNNIHTMELAFTELPPICLQTHRVRHLAQGGGDTRGPRFFPREHIERAESLLPTREILQFSTGNTLEKLGFFSWNPYELDPGGSQNTGRILATLWTHQKTTRDPGVCKSRGAITLHVGLVAENNRTTDPPRQFNGIAYRPGRSMVVRVRPNEGPDINFPAGGTTLAHEIGHNFGRRHVNCGNPDGPDSNYPYPPCQMGPIGVGAEGVRSVFHGADLMDPANPRIIAPRSPDAGTTLSDLLSYANERWTSDYTWAAIRTYMLQNQKAMKKDGEAGSAPAPWLAGAGSVHANWLSAARSTDGRTILLTAVIDEEGTVDLEMILPVSETVVPEEKALDLVAKNFAAAKANGAYTIELLDGGGNVLEAIPAVADEIDDVDVPASTLGVLLPMPENLETIRIKDDGGNTLAETDRSPAPPQVTLNLPGAGEVVDDILTVDWDATDPDGDDLTAMIQYSDDDGASWITLTIDAPDSPQAFDAELIPGAPAAARIRLIVSDGFNATEVMSEAFTVLPRAPAVAITRPRGGAAFAAGEPIFLSGNAYDPEDGPILEESLVWEVEGIGEAGFGRSLILGNLPPGAHRVTLTATDSDGEAASDEVTITIDNPRATRGQVISVLKGIIRPEGERVFDLNEDGIIDGADILHTE